MCTDWYPSDSRGKLEVAIGIHSHKVLVGCTNWYPYGKRGKVYLLKPY